MVIKGTFADGSAMTAIPNFARKNRDPASPVPPALPEAGGAFRPATSPATSIVWIKET